MVRITTTTSINRYGVTDQENGHVGDADSEEDNNFNELDGRGDGNSDAGHSEGGDANENLEAGEEGIYGKNQEPNVSNLDNMGNNQS